MFRSSHFAPQPGHVVRCLIVGAYEHYHFSGRSGLGDPAFDWQVHASARSLEPSHYEAVLYADSFLAREFRALHKWPHEHKLTAAFAEYVLPHAAALIYPSVEAKSGFNIAIHPSVFDTEFEVVDVTLFHVERILGMGVIRLQQVCRSSSFDTAGNIAWGQETIERREWHPSFGHRVVAPRAWRVSAA
jgi:hypothetical protein